MFDSRIPNSSLVAFEASIAGEIRALSAVTDFFSMKDLDIPN